MISFIPWDAFFGGILLGASAIILMLGIGRVAGISGIVSRLLPSRKNESLESGPESSSDTRIELSPMMCSKMLKANEKPSKFEQKVHHILDGMTNRYEKMKSAQTSAQHGTC